MDDRPDSPRRPPAPRIRPVPAVSRAAAILRLLGRSETPLGVNAIARALGLVPSTCLHILRALAVEELVAFDADTRRYRLDAGTLTLARSFMRRNGFAELAQPLLDRLSERHDVTAIAVQVLGLEHMVAVAISRTPARVQLHVEIGSRFPALISATGRCLAAFGGHPPEEVERRFAELRWDRAPSLETWRAEVAAAKRDGWALDDGNYIAGVAILAVPVPDGGGTMTHGLVAIGLRERLAQADRAALAAQMRAGAAAIAGRLWPDGGPPPAPPG